MLNTARTVGGKRARKPAGADTHAGGCAPEAVWPRWTLVRTDVDLRLAQRLLCWKPGPCAGHSRRLEPA